MFLEAIEGIGREPTGAEAFDEAVGGGKAASERRHPSARAPPHKGLYSSSLYLPQFSKKPEKADCCCCCF